MIGFGAWEAGGDAWDNAMYGTAAKAFEPNLYLYDAYPGGIGQQIAPIKNKVPDPIAPAQ